MLRDFPIDRFAPRVERLLEAAAAGGTGLKGSTLVAHRAAVVAEQTIANLIDDTPA